MKIFILAAFLSIIDINPIKAQDDSSRQFIGVWTPNKIDGYAWLGNIKISLESGKLLVQIKKHGEIQKCENVRVESDNIEFRCKSVRNLYTYHGRQPAYGDEYYSLGHPNIGGEIHHIYWEGRNRIEEKIGRPTNVNSRLCANKVISSCVFMGKLIDGNMQLSVKFDDDYYLDDYYGFSQETDWTYYSTYSNW